MLKYNKTNKGDVKVSKQIYKTEVPSQASVKVTSISLQGEAWEKHVLPFEWLIEYNSHVFGLKPMGQSQGNNRLRCPSFLYEKVVKYNMLRL